MSSAVPLPLPDIVGDGGQLAIPAGRLIAAKEGIGPGALTLSAAVVAGRRLTVRVVCASNGRLVVNAAAGSRKLVLGGGCNPKAVYTGTLVGTADDRALAIAIPADAHWKLAVWQA